jgi:hypothetical protein
MKRAPATAATIHLFNHHAAFAMLNKYSLFFFLLLRNCIEDDILSSSVADLKMWQTRVVMVMVGVG